MNGWREVRLKDLASIPITNGLGERGEHEDPAWPRYIRTTDIEGPNSLRAETFKSLPPTVARAALVEPGDILMTAAGATIGKSYRHSGDAPACYAGYLVRFRPRPHVDGRFISYWTQSQPYWDQISVGAVRSTIDNFSAGKYRQLRLALPPLDEQRRIADFLDTETTRLDRLLQLRATQAQVFAERRASLILDLIGGASAERKRSDLEWLPMVPTHWPTVGLTLVARLGSGHTPSRSRPEWWLNPTIPWVTTGEVAQMRSDRLENLTETRELISEVGLANSAAEVHPRGTVVLSRTASVGYSAVMGADMATSQDFATWACGPRLDPYFLLWCFRAMRPWLVGARAMGSTHKTIYMPDIQALRIPLPPIGEQRLIVESVRAALGRLDRVTDALQTQAQLLRERRQAIITAAVTGQFDVTTPERGLS